MGFMDQMRGLYVQSPPWLNKLVAPLLAQIPVSWRFGATYSQLRSAISRSENDSFFVDHYQMDRLRGIIRACGTASPYYRQVFKQVFGRIPDPASFSRENLFCLPVLTKKQLRHTLNDLLVKPLNAVDRISTSGSSGQPFEFYLDRDRSVKEWAFVHHLWSRIGYQPQHKRAVLRGIHMPDVEKKTWQYDPALAEVRLSPFHLVPDIMDIFLQLIHDYHVHFIHGYPSAISLLAQQALRNKWTPPSSLLGILPISESLLPHQRELIASGFGGVKVCMFYGLSEKVAIAGELPEDPDVYEFEPLYGITELIDDAGRQLEEPGKKGRLVSTGLISEAMPLLRYDTDDVAELVQTPTFENCYRLRVRNIRSRWGQEYVVGNNGALISIAAINIHSPAYAHIQSFQFYQDRAGTVDVRVVPVSGSTADQLNPFVREIQDKAGASITFRLVVTDTLSSNTRAKRPFVDQRLDLRNIM